MKKFLIVLSLLVIVSSAQAEFTVTAINGKPIPPTEFSKLVGTSTNKVLSGREKAQQRREELLRKNATNTVVNPTTPKK